MQFTGDDFFADKNVCSIVVELPNSALGTNVMGLWARTLDKTGEGWIQADRGGRPLQAVFLPGEEREAYLNGEPADNDRFIGVKCEPKLNALPNFITTIDGVDIHFIHARSKHKNALPHHTRMARFDHRTHDLWRKAAIGA